MKKLLLSLSLMQGISAMAQVTLTTNELPFAGMSYIVSEDIVTNAPATTRQDEIYIYPNPSNGFVNVRSEDNRLDNAMIEFYSVTDMQVGHAKLKTGLNQVSVHNLNEGIYAYRIFADNKVIHEGKLIIKY